MEIVSQTKSSTFCFSYICQNHFHMKKLILVLVLSLLCFSFLAVNSWGQPAPTKAAQRMEGFKQRKRLEDNSLVKAVKFRSVGPTIMSGRVVDVDVNPNNTKEFYVAYASGGLWKTENNGLSFTPLFDNEAVMTIGDIAVDWKHGETIWIGTGENNSSRSSYSGLGMYKSIDKGKTWQQMGLDESHHIGRIIMHPNDPNVLWVAVIGHLYTTNKERGMYKTTDGGKTWKQTLFINDSTGVIDCIVDPSNPSILYASAWQRDRKAWNFSEAGRGSGIYKSMDGGDTWSLISISSSGFPSNVSGNIGRIGLCISPQNTKVLYAVVDNQNRKQKEKKKDEKFHLSKDTLKKISVQDFLKMDDKLINEFLEEKDFPKKYNSKTVKELVRKGKIKPIALAEYLEDANSLLFDTDVIGAEVYRSDDAGKTWKKTHDGYLDGMYNTYGYYFGQIKISSTDENKIVIIGYNCLQSNDGGKTFYSLDADNMHVDLHAVWINPYDDKHIIIGNDGGLNLTYDGGKNYFKLNTPSVGQFYSVNVDMESPYNVYGGLQDNGVWWGPSDYKYSSEWQQVGKYPYKFLLGGDGMQVAVDTTDNNTVYTGFQFGNYFRANKTTGQLKYITPSHDLGERPYRWNWQSPIQISKHNHEIIYFGSNHFHRSMNRGGQFKKLSADLSNGGKKGDVSYATLTSIDESPIRFGLIYAGTDDGNIHVSKDAGYSWTKTSSTLPKDLWVSRLAASSHDEATVYASLNGYRFDDFSSYLYISKNYGTTWQKIGLDLPSEPINVVKEDPKNSNIIYVGTDNGVYVSLNKGMSFMKFGYDLPSVAVHDLVIHPKENDIVLGTHGRSIWIASVKEVQQLTDTLMQKQMYVFELKDKQYSEKWGKTESKFSDKLIEDKLQIPFWTNTNRIVAIEVKTDSGLVLRTFNDTTVKGINYFEYDLSIDTLNVKSYIDYLNAVNKDKENMVKVEKAENGNYYLMPNKYLIRITDKSTGITISKEFKVKEPEKSIRETPLSEE